MIVGRPSIRAVVVFVVVDSQGAAQRAVVGERKAGGQGWESRTLEPARRRHAAAAANAADVPAHGNPRREPPHIHRESLHGDAIPFRTFVRVQLHAAPAPRAAVALVAQTVAIPEAVVVAAAATFLSTRRFLRRAREVCVERSSDGEMEEEEEEEGPAHQSSVSSDQLISRLCVVRQFSYLFASQIFGIWPFSKWSVLVPTVPSEPQDCCYGQASALATYGSFKTPHLIISVEIMA